MRLRLRHVMTQLFTSYCQYFRNEKTFVRTTEVKQCVKITKIALYFLKTALLSANQN